MDASPGWGILQMEVGVMRSKQSLEPIKEQIPSVAGFIALAAGLLKRSFAVFGDVLIQFCDANRRCSVYLQSKPESSHLCQSFDRLIHLDNREGQPDNGNQQKKRSDKHRSSAQLFPA